MSTVVSPSNFDSPPVPLWRLTVQQYHDMIRSGILTADDPVELLEGWLVQKMPKNPRHSIVSLRLRQCLEKAIPAGWFVQSQEPVTLPDSEPEPDAFVVRGTPDDYLQRHPGPVDLGLVIEVSDTSLARDQGVKLRLYARSQLPAYWIVNLQDNQLEVYADPTGPSPVANDRSRHVYRAGDVVSATLDGAAIQVAVSDLFA
jgi:Uma2 family endonuclease